MCHLGMRGSVVLASIACCFALAAGASGADVDDCLSQAGLSCTQMKLGICPAGDFERVAGGCGGTGAYIWIEARTSSNVPIRGIPWTDYWLGACDPARQLALCAAPPVAADSLTGVNGRTTLSGCIGGGGCSLAQGIWIAIQGKVIKKKPCPSVTQLCLNIVVKGPDVTGASGSPDGVVALDDFSRLGASYNKASGQTGYNACFDFNDDNIVNLSDFAFFREHYQHRCY